MNKDDQQKINFDLMVHVDQQNLKQFYQFLLYLMMELNDDIIEELLVMINFYLKNKKFNFFFFFFKPYKFFKSFSLCSRYIYIINL